jgi:hypothetical protein
MPTPSDIQLSMKVNGGAAQTGVVTVDYEDTIVLTLGSSATGVKRATYRIWEYPDGFTCPAGWSTNASGYGYYVTVANGADAPSFDLPESPLWGNFYFSVEVNGRLRDGVVAEDLFDESLVAKIPSLSGIGDVGFGETNQVDGTRQWAGTLKAMLRMLDNAIGGNLDTKTATHTSSGASYETIEALTYELAEGYFVDVTLSATGDNGTEYGHYEKVARFTRQVGGSAAEDWNVDIYGSPREVSDLVWDTAIVLDGNDITIQVKANSDDPDWRVTRVVTVQRLPNYTP